MANDSRPKDEKEKSRVATEADRVAVLKVVIGAALRSLSSQVAFLNDHLKFANETEQRERREHQASELYWIKTGAKAAIVFSIVSLFLSALTLGVLYRTLAIYRAQATIMATQATIMSKQREITEKTLSAMQAQAAAAMLAAQAAKSQADSSKIEADAAALSVRTARDTLRITEGADVNMEAIECSPPSAFSLNTMMKLRYRNSGRTRADNFESVFSVGIPNALPAEEPAVPAGEVGVASVGAGASIPSGTIGTVGNILSKNVSDVPPEQTFQKIVAGQLKFEFRGYVQYTDVLKETHRKNFEYIWDRNFPNDCLFTVVRAPGQ